MSFWQKPRLSWKQGPRISDNQAIFVSCTSQEIFLAMVAPQDDAWAFWRKARPNVTDEAIASRVANSLREDDGKIVWKHDQAGITECRINPAPGRGAPDLWPSVEAVQCPALIIRGGVSDYLQTATAEAVCERSDKFTMYEIPLAGHYVHDDNPEAFLNVIRPFLDQNRMK